MISREGTRPLPSDNQARKTRPTFTETLKGQFRALMNAITNQRLTPQPVQRRRRTEDTGKAFRRTARKMMPRAARIPAAAYRATAYLWDTLDWLNPWRHDASTTGELDDDYQYGEQQHLSLHL